MTALPPNKRMEDKAYVGFFEEGKLTAVLDWISGYPTKETAWIGLFMVSEERQGQGVGSGIIRGLTESMRAVVSGDSARRGQRKSAELRVLEEKRV